ncbi:MAG: hypothetical protein ABWY16_05045 [Pedobacter sp.]|uniref:hypothetical protein n=1 Tax=Pedobacter sp. TaxID=1411316 RepID=UPI00339927A5
MMKPLLYIILLLLLQGIFSSCKKNSGDIAFDAPQKQYDLTVEGGINTFYSMQAIRLTKPSLDPNVAPQPIRKASVIVNDGRADLVFRELDTLPGVYVAYNTRVANYNYGYTLTVKYNSQTYTAVDTLRQVVNIVDDYLPFSVTKTPDNIYSGTVPKHTFGYLNPNKWWINYAAVLRDTWWSPEKFTKANFYSYTHVLGSPNSLYPLTNLKHTFSLSAKNFVAIYKFSVSERYAKYLYSVFLETDWNGLFSSVPVNITGNVSGNAQGYFSVSDVDYKAYRAEELR